MPTLASTSRAQLRYIEESDFAVTPDSGDAINLRMTGETLGFQPQKEESNEIRDDRQTTDLILVGAQAAGGVNFEWSYGEFDRLMEAALQGEWAVFGTDGVSGAVFEADFTTTTITADSATTGDDAFTKLAKGQWFRLIAPNSPNDGKILKVSESVAPTTTVITVDAGTPLEADEDVANCKISTSRLTNGVIQRSFSIERSFSDVEQFFLFRGMVPSKMSLNFASGQIVTGMFDFMGRDALREDSTLLPGTPQASLTYDVMNAVSHVGQIYEGTSPLTGTFIKSLNFELDNKLRIQDAISILGAAGIGSGTLSLKGTIQVYLTDGTMYDKFIENLASKLSLVCADGSGNGYAITFPNIKYDDARVNAGAKDQDALLEMPFTALMDPATEKTVYIDRFGAAATWYP